MMLQTNDAPKSVLIKGAYVIDPLSQLDSINDILIINGLIKKVSPDITDTAEIIIDASGLFAAPGLIDMHVHLRDPGFTHKEDIASGTQAAAAGGFTAIACMPNTNPPIDSAEILNYIKLQSAGCPARVYPVACITKGMQGKELSDYDELKQAGAVAVSDDGRPVENAALMLGALKACAQKSLPVTSHCEDLSIISGGIVNEGAVSEALGVKGMHRASEDSITAREIALAESLDVPVHIAHVSTKGSVGIIRSAKARGVKVTCETAPHYFTLTEEKLLSKDANYRMNPPLRCESDRLAVIEGILDGTIDAIATDHAPHAPQEKANFYKAPNGVVGLETSLAVSITSLVKTGLITLSRLVELMSLNPARILGVAGGTLTPGAAADIVLFDVNEEYTVNPEVFRSKSRNTPFAGMKLAGRVKYTLMGGSIVYKD
ncbi:dihydroorotase [Acetanaerobacterium elongatum]|uniref:Dihydroorotase n=1 Tax=Acetanaerobacterium elongatum TaxID=258515 RepID=A0A1H0FPV6_9FIRM|nr:dihydroorotase [Acetanaerobacterium elongatum]SDN96667.1 dihydroorotase [Acetanaerobacterium elongatum]